MNKKNFFTDMDASFKWIFVAGFIGILFVVVEVLDAVDALAPLKSVLYAL